MYSLVFDSCACRDWRGIVDCTLPPLSCMLMQLIMWLSLKKIQKVPTLIKWGGGCCTFLNGRVLLYLSTFHQHEKKLCFCVFSCARRMCSSSSSSLNWTRVIITPGDGSHVDVWCGFDLNVLPYHAYYTDWFHVLLRQESLEKSLIF